VLVTLSRLAGHEADILSGCWTQSPILLRNYALRNRALEFFDFPSHAHTTCSGFVPVSSVSRVDRRLWNSFGHGISPALRMMFSNVVRRFWDASR
jgi:hypothetical protein